MLRNILLLFFLGTAYLSAVHIHVDEHHHTGECEICVIVQNFNSADIPDIKVDIASLESTYFNDFKINTTFSYPIQKGFYSTAPPLD